MADVIHRRAVRAVAFHGPLLLMMHVPRVGGFKFPGGGVGSGETDWEALDRELREETGRALEDLGPVVYVDIAERPDRAVRGAMFRHESVYYIAHVSDHPVQPPQLDSSEKAARMMAGWITWDLAVAANRDAVRHRHADEYLSRDLRVLEELRDILYPGHATASSNPDA